MTGFTFETTPRILCEDGASGRLGQLAAELGIKRPLIVTDRGLFELGVLDDALDSFKAAGLPVELFRDVLADPPEASIEAAARFARARDTDGVIGLGGGSSMDTAKLVALLAGLGGQTLTQAYGVERARGPRLPLIQVPTTAGTGSEVTSIAIVTTPDDQKVGVVSRLLYPDIAVLDATLTFGLPPRITAMTGIDAMVHAIEGYTSRIKKNPVSDSLALKALELLSGSIRAAVADGRDVVARRAMLQGSLLAGMAFANAPVGAVHALAYPIGGLFHVPHGLSNALVLSPVLAFNQEAAQAHYAELCRVVAPRAAGATTEAAAAGFVAAMRQLVADMPMEQRLTQVGVRRQDIERMATDAMKVSRLLVNNPRDVSHQDAVDLYLKAL
ncbi:iron-containing alcohol dehydrogenase [Caulobacter sp. 602-1]|uniref:iron-containing alcohol dehydrogenase n=2 Tax=unclassified Caulobacter TaxID=2648921 RepID=UPI000F63CD3C|nr:iron-containing alcohol dehydrogenase [Caulobacter sp. 602-1]RRN66029.1 iron-containing alcohol dehydrogenase [Caulobacter sp. 602-1]